MCGRGYAIDEAGPSSATNQPKSPLMIMGRELSLFIGTFTTLLAVINPFEVMPVYLKLLEEKTPRSIARLRGKHAFTRYS